MASTLARSAMAATHLRPTPTGKGDRWRACPHCLTPAVRRAQRRREARDWRREVADAVAQRG